LVNPEPSLPFDAQIGGKPLNKPADLRALVNIQVALDGKFVAASKSLAKRG
jgi:hypothetical protein